MAKQMSYTAPTGTVYASSYWMAVSVALSRPDRTATVMFYGYADADARTAGKAPVAQKVYSIAGAAFDTYFSAANLDTKDLYAVTYDLADATLDTAGASFFNGASNV